MRLVTARRMAAAQNLLANSDHSIREVASRVGIADYNYFTKVFKKETGQTPSLWRRQQRLASGKQVQQQL
jgi:AraC-like DNA-binding protein